MFILPEARPKVFGLYPVKVTVMREVDTELHQAIHLCFGAAALPMRRLFRIRRREKYQIKTFSRINYKINGFDSQNWLLSVIICVMGLRVRGNDADIAGADGAVDVLALGPGGLLLSGSLSNCGCRHPLRRPRHTQRVLLLW
jgi:hypothetical protein